MLHVIKASLAATILLLASGMVSAQTFNPVTPTTDAVRAAHPFKASPLEMVAHRKSSRQPRVFQERRVRLGAGTSDVPVSVVGPDNYKYARQACCF